MCVGAYLPWRVCIARGRCAGAGSLLPHVGPRDAGPEGFAMTNNSLVLLLNKVESRWVAKF